MQRLATLHIGFALRSSRTRTQARATLPLPAAYGAALIAFAACLYAADARAEPEPTLPTRSLAGAHQPLVGEGWRVATPAPVRGYLGRYTIETRHGEIVAEGRELLAVRIAELPAVATLESLGEGEVFATALAQGVRSTGKSVVRVVTHPVDTVAGIPAGIGRLLDRTARSVRRVAGAVGDAARRDDDAGEGAAKPNAGERIEDFAREAAGLNRARREIARATGLDPYTRNPLAAERLRSLAWAAVAGGVSVDLAVGAIGGVAGRVVGVSGKLDDLVWSEPPDAIRARLEAVLAARGHSPEGMRAFFRNPWFTPTLQLAFVDALTALGTPAGEPAALDVAARAGSEAHARFLIQQLRMLSVHLAAGDAVRTLESLDASYAATMRSGRWLVTLPVDYLSWTEAVQARADDRPAMPVARKLVVAGAVSPKAARELARRGYAVIAGVGLAG